MVKKSESKSSRGEQYRAILAEYGKRLEDCRVLAFAFDGPGGPAVFHYELMHPLRPVYHLFDTVAKRGRVFCRSHLRAIWRP